MTIQMICEGCGQRIKVPDHAAGRKGKCPACGREILIPGQSAATQGPEKPLATGPLADAAQVVKDDTRNEASSPRTTIALGVASLVLGVLALLVAWIPLLGLLAWPLGGVGL